MFTLAYLAYAAGQAALAVWTWTMWRREREFWILALMLPMAAVVYDNTIVALGSFIGAGSALEVLTVPRFLGHALFTPIWIIGSVGLMLRTGVFPRAATALRIASYVLYAIMAIIGVLNEVVFFEGKLVTQGDVLYYTNVGRIMSPPPPSLTMVLVTLLAGLVVFWRMRWPWMAVGALLVGAAQAARGVEAAFVVVNSAEVLMAASLALTLWKVQHTDGLTDARGAGTHVEAPTRPREA